MSSRRLWPGVAALSVGRLLEAEGHAGVGVGVGGVQGLGPGLKGLGGGGEGLAVFGAGGEVDLVEVGFAIGAIQADDQVEGRGGIHGVFWVR